MNKTKTCPKCREVKSFNIHSSYCLDCRKIYAASIKDKASSYSRAKNKTIDGKIKNTYINMKRRVRSSGVRWAKYYKGQDICSKELFYLFSINNINLKYLMLKWKESGYNRSLTPSIDRINPNKGYVTNNMQWITSADNARKSVVTREERRSHAKR